MRVEQCAFATRHDMVAAKVMEHMLNFVALGGEENTPERWGGVRFLVLDRLPDLAGGGLVASARWTRDRLNMRAQAFGLSP